jgi:hypothetical protein
MQNTLVVSDELALANVKSNSWSVLFIDDPTGNEPCDGCAESLKEQRLWR